MSEPDIIRSGTPHEVVVPEGSHDARSKASNIGGPAKPKFVKSADNLAEDIPSDKHMVLVPEALAVPELKDTTLKSSTAPAPAPRQPAAPAEKPVKPTAQAAPASAAALPPDMPEMDFPARVIHIKIENDRVRSELDGLELSLKKPL